MERVTDRIRAIYLDQETNCAESLFRAALESRGIQAPADCCRMMSGYSGGVSSEHLCGALLGGVAAISYLINQGDEESFERSKEAAAAFFTACQEAFGTVICHEIKVAWRKEDIRCMDAVERMAELLENILEQFAAPGTAD